MNITSTSYTNRYFLKHNPSHFTARNSPVFSQQLVISWPFLHAIFPLSFWEEGHCDCYFQHFTSAMLSWRHSGSTISNQSLRTTLYIAHVITNSLKIIPRRQHCVWFSVVTASLSVWSVIPVPEQQPRLSEATMNSGICVVRCSEQQLRSEYSVRLLQAV